MSHILEVIHQSEYGSGYSVISFLLALSLAVNIFALIFWANKQGYLNGIKNLCSGQDRDKATVQFESLANDDNVM